MGWKRPFLSFSVMSALLLVAYNDLVRYALPLALLSNVAYLLGKGLGSPARVIQSAASLISLMFEACYRAHDYSRVVAISINRV